MFRRFAFAALLIVSSTGDVTAQPARAQAIADAVSPAVRDGSHDFDFLIGDWKAHVRRLPDRLVGSTKWVEYDGISNHHKTLDSDANFEEFDVRNAGGGHLRAQTLRLYNSATRPMVDLPSGHEQRNAGPAAIGW